MGRYRRPESVLVLIFDDQHRVLTLQRQHPPDFWQSVTGALEAGETPRQAAVRELYEETALTGQLVDLHHSARFAIRGAWRKGYAPSARYNLEHHFAIRIKADAAIRLSEHQTYCWLDALSAARTMSSWSNRQALALALTADLGDPDTFCLADSSARQRI